MISSSGPLQRDTKQQELIKSSKKATAISAPLTLKKSSISAGQDKREMLRNGSASLVAELQPLFPHVSKEQILEQLEATEFDVDKTKERLTDLQRTILLSPQMTRSFAVKQTVRTKLGDRKEVWFVLFVSLFKIFFRATIRLALSIQSCREKWKREKAQILRLGAV